MPHVTFVHGIGNKPEPEDLLGEWRVALRDDGGVDLDALGVTSSMVYWADLLYASPAPPAAAQEATAFELEQSVDPEDADMTWLQEVPAAEREFVERLGREVGLAEVLPSSAGPPDPVLAGSALEAVPLPPWLTQRLMRVLLRDVHHYLFDTPFSPRAGADPVPVREAVRTRAVDAFRAAAKRPGPHVVVAHSLGTVIAYDVLTASPAVASVDALVTVGSPLGISEVRDALTPPWTPHDGWPTPCLAEGTWDNLFDPLDPVCGGPDRRLGTDYRRDGAVAVRDSRVANRGSWKHSVSKYLGQEKLRDLLRAVLDRAAEEDTSGTGGRFPVGGAGVRLAEGG
jgi:hypothetical protein